MLVLKDFFGSRKTFRSECNGAKGARGVESGARNRGGRGPSGVAVTVPSGRRSTPKRLKRNETNGENV